MFANRIRTGFKDRTIPNPSTLSYSGLREVYEGPVSGYDFKKQKANFVKLENALFDAGVQFTEVSGIVYDGDCGYNHRFVVLTNRENVLWYKYVGYAAQGGQNHMFIHGCRIKVSIFLSESADVRRALLDNRLDDVDRLTKPGHLDYINESKDLWS